MLGVALASSRPGAAGTRHQLAQYCERLPGCGELARATYAEILELHPGYSLAPEVAQRLGTLYDGIILQDTERDEGKAIECYNWVLNFCPLGRYVRLKAHLCLGNLGEGREHFEAIYEFDPTLAILQPDLGTGSSERVERQWQRLREDVLSIKQRARTKLVNACIAQSAHDTLANLADLLARYDDDLELADLIESEMLAAVEAGDDAGLVGTALGWLLDWGPLPSSANEAPVLLLGEDGSQ